MKIVKKIGWALLIIFIAMQFYRPEKNTAVEPHDEVFARETNPGNEVHQILKNACFDCHSNTTRYPWYYNVAPVSYWMADHVKHGKHHLNFSEWNKYDGKKKDHKMEDIIEMVEKDEMPLEEYVWMHHDAQLSPEQKKSVLLWAKKTRVIYQINSISK